MLKADACQMRSNVTEFDDGSFHRLLPDIGVGRYVRCATTERTIAHTSPRSFSILHPQIILLCVDTGLIGVTALVGAFAQTKKLGDGLSSEGAGDDDVGLR
jgi:hypothetical protein